MRVRERHAGGARAATARSSRSNSAALTAVVPSSMPSSSSSLTDRARRRGRVALRLARAPTTLRRGVRAAWRARAARPGRGDGDGSARTGPGAIAPSSASMPDDVLADRKRRRQARGADRRHVHQPRQRARALDHVVGVAPGRAQTQRRRRSARAPRARVHAPGPREDQLGASGSTDQSRLSSRSRAVGPAITARRSSVGNTSTPLPSARGDRQQDLLQRRAMLAPRTRGTRPCGDRSRAARRPPLRAIASA